MKWLSLRLVLTSDLLETLPVDCPDESSSCPSDLQIPLIFFETLSECRSLKSSIMTYNCNFKGNGYLEYFI